MCISNKENIALIGFMATGKTTVGKALVERIGRGYEFIETDQTVMEITGKSIPRIFCEEGEPAFRNYEIEACNLASKSKRVVISCGGGIVLYEENLLTLSKTCHIVLLNASINEIIKRSINDGKEKRPLINKPNPREEIMRIYEYRKPLYMTHAELIIDTTNKQVSEIVEIIVKEFKLDK